MISAYRVFIAAEVVVALRSCPSAQKKKVAGFFDALAKNPSLAGD